MSQSKQNNTVLAHPDVVSGGVVGYARRTPNGELEFHTSIDSVGSELLCVPLDEVIKVDPKVADAARLQPSQHAWRWAPSTEFNIARLPDGDTYYMQVSVTPTDDHSEVSVVASAMIECWVRCPTPDEALSIVHDTLVAENWRIRQIDGPEFHTGDDYIDEPEFFQYYEQVQTDGEVFVYHMAPKPSAR